MADELQALLDKITDEGVRKADRERDALLAQAKEEAAALIAEAKATAAKTLADAKQQSELLVRKGEEALQQAARDIKLSLKQELQARVKTAVSDLMKEQLSGEAFAALVADVITAYMKDGGETEDITVLLNAKQLEALAAQVKAKLASDLQAHCQFAPAPGLAAGFKLVFAGNDVMYDFSDQSLAEAMAAHVGPKIAAALFEK